MTAPIELPLAERELHQSGKRPTTFLYRMGVVGLLVVAMAFGMLVSVPSLLGGAPGEVGERIGATVMGLAKFLNLVVAFLLVPVLGCGLVAREKQERTLALLLTADFRGWDIFLAKFLAVFIQTELLILGTLPILAMASFFGGIPVPEMALHVLLMTIACAATCSVTLLCSTLTSRPLDALLLSISLIALATAATLVVDFGLLRPYAPWLNLPGASTNILRAAWLVDEPGLGTWYWLPAGLLALGVVVAATFLTVWLLPRQAYVKARGRRKGWRLGRRLWPMSNAARLAAAAMAGGGASRSMSLRGLLVLALVVAVPLVASGLACLPLLAVTGPLVVVAILAFETAATVQAAQRLSLLDDILVSPLDDSVLARAFIRVIAERSVLFFILLLALDGRLFFVYLLLFETGEDVLRGVAPPWLLLWYVPVGILLFTAVAAHYMLCVGMGGFAATLRVGPLGAAVTTSAVFFGVSMLITILLLIITMVLAVAEGFDPTGAVAARFLSICIVLTTATVIYAIAAWAFYRVFTQNLGASVRSGLVTEVWHRPDALRQPAPPGGRPV